MKSVEKTTKQRRQQPTVRPRQQQQQQPKHAHMTAETVEKHTKKNRTKSRFNIYRITHTLKVNETKRKKKKVALNRTLMVERARARSHQ